VRLQLTSSSGLGVQICVCLFDLRVSICASIGQEVQYLEVPHVLGSFDHRIIIMIRTQDTMSGNVGESVS
jgi:hypothetical protein